MNRKYRRAIIVAITLFTLFVTQHVHAQVNRDAMPIIDDGMGNGSYGKGNNAAKTLDEFIKNLPFTFLNLSSESSQPTDIEPTFFPPDITSIPNPNETTMPLPTLPIPTRNPSSTFLNTQYDYPAEYVNNAQSCLQNKSIYQAVENNTGVMWEIIAGIHFLEGSCTPTKSCVSGRSIGTNEPDIRGNCSAANTGVGKPNPLPGGGCGFTNLLDSCIYGANHLKGKINKTPETLEEFAKALGRYNGTGNANCGKTPFTGCPPPYEGYDHIYPFSKFDDAHQNMYLVYCADYTVCNPPRPFSRIGVLTVASILSRY